MLQIHYYANCTLMPASTPVLHKWDKAIAAADAVINSGKYSLEGDFFTNFKTDNSGSKEIYS